jgi:hypothetical protein
VRTLVLPALSLAVIAAGMAWLALS